MGEWKRGVNAVAASREAMGVGGGASESYGALFKVRGLAQLLGATLAARIATQISSVLLVLFVLQTRHSVALSGVVVVCSQVPGIVVSPVAGALLDRGRRVRLMRVDYVVGASCIAAIAVLSMMRALPTPLLLLLVSASSLTAPLSRVGGRALYPIMVPKPLWDRTNAADTSVFLVSTIVGPAVAGVAAAVVGASHALFLPAVFSFVAVVLLCGFQVVETPSPAPTSLLGDAWAAIEYVWRNRVLRVLAGSMTAFNACYGALTVAIPFVVLRELHGSSTTVGLSFSVMGIVGVLSGLVTGNRGTESREKWVITVSCLTTAGAFGVLALDRRAVLLVTLIAVVGIANGALTVALFSLRQRATDPQWFGRAFAVSMNLNFVGSPIGASLAGILLTHSVPLAFISCAICAVAGAFCAAALPEARYGAFSRDAEVVDLTI